MIIIIDCIHRNQLQVHRNLLNRLRNENLTVNLKKSQFGCATVTYLDHVVGQGKLTPVQAKLK